MNNLAISISSKAKKQVTYIPEDSGRKNKYLGFRNS